MDIKRVEDYMKEKHKGQTRKQGTPYYYHPLITGAILKMKGFSEDYVAAALCHDLLEDTDASMSEIERLTSKEVTDAVILVTKEEGYIAEDYIKRIKENDLARMVKLSDRLHNLLDGVNAGEDFKRKYIKETKDYYFDLSKGSIFERLIKDATKYLETGSSDSDELKAVLDLIFEVMNI